MKRIALLMMAFVIVTTPAPVGGAAETWTETKSAHFVVWSDASERQTRDLLWQLEQIRFAVGSLWPWAQLNLAKPLLVVAVKDEQSMKRLAPEFWEQKGRVHPVSVWASGADRHYMAIRADLRGDNTALTNPYTSAYFSYVNLILAASFGRDLPLWFSRGLAGVLSNTIVRDTQILLGPTIPWHLETLRTAGRLHLRDLIGVTRASREYTQGDKLERFDAQAWALVHFLMFGHNAQRQSGINKFAIELNNGKAPEPAFVDAFGRVEDLESDFATYITRSLYSYQKVVLDRQTTREQFMSRPLPSAESAAGRAAFHVAMGRQNEARALVDEARKADPNSADAYVAEALALRRDNKPDEAGAAFVKAASLGTANPHAYYRAAMSLWGATEPDAAAFQKMETYLARAAELNPVFAESYASLAEVRAALGKPADDIIALLTKAVTLDPSDPWIRISAARALWRLDREQEARKVARVALNLAADDERAQAEAQRLLAAIPESTPDPARPARPGAPAAAPVSSPNDQTPNPNALVAACQGGDATACRDLFPLAEKACAAGQKRACVVTGTLLGRGMGVPRDEARAASILEPLCSENMLEACTQWAVLLASDSKKPDYPRARALLTKSCSGGQAQACEMLKGFPK